MPDGVTAGVPVAASSVNELMGLSPKTAEHVREGLGDAVDLVVDARPPGGWWKSGGDGKCERR